MKLTLLLLLLAASAALSAVRPPNIVFILTDDWGWGDLGCYGHQQIKTPNLDRMAGQGLRFSQFYVCSGVCSPSRTAFMTGRFPASYAIHGHLATDEQNADRGMPNFLDPKATTVTRLLQQAGYATAHFGKWHLGAGPTAPPPTAYGIDVCRTVNASDPNGWKEGRDPYFRARSTDPPEKLARGIPGSACRTTKLRLHASLPTLGIPSFASLFARRDLYPAWQRWAQTISCRPNGATPASAEYPACRRHRRCCATPATNDSAHQHSKLGTVPALRC